MLGTAKWIYGFAISGLFGELTAIGQAWSVEGHRKGEGVSPSWPGFAPHRTSIMLRRPLFTMLSTSTIRASISASPKGES